MIVTIIKLGLLVFSTIGCITVIEWIGKKYGKNIAILTMLALTLFTIISAIIMKMESVN